MELIFTPQIRLVITVVLAMLLGGIIGVDREFSGRPAGLRTHVLVGGAAALIVALGDTLVKRLGLGSELMRADPLRVIEAVITGVSFLGAGTIFRRSDSDHVEGLTTAASLLFVAVVGVCTAVGQIGTAVVMTVFALVGLPSGVWLEGFFQKPRQ